MQTKSNKQTKTPTLHPPLFLAYFCILYNPVVLPSFFLKYHTKLPPVIKMHLTYFFILTSKQVLHATLSENIQLTA